MVFIFCCSCPVDISYFHWWIHPFCSPLHFFVADFFMLFIFKCNKNERLLSFISHSLTFLAGGVWGTCWESKDPARVNNQWKQANSLWALQASYCWTSQHRLVFTFPLRYANPWAIIVLLVVGSIISFNEEICPKLFPFMGCFAYIFLICSPSWNVQFEGESKVGCLEGCWR